MQLPIELTPLLVMLLLLPRQELPLESMERAMLQLEMLMLLVIVAAAVELAMALLLPLMQHHSMAVEYTKMVHLMMLRLQMLLHSLFLKEDHAVDVSLLSPSVYQQT